MTGLGLLDAVMIDATAGFLSGLPRDERGFYSDGVLPSPIARFDERLLVGEGAGDFAAATRGNNSILTAWVHTDYEGNDIFARPTATTTLSAGIDADDATIAPALSGRWNSA